MELPVLGIAELNNKVMKDIEFIELAKNFLRYSFNDISSYSELTLTEKKFCSEEQFDLLLKYIS